MSAKVDLVLRIQHAGIIHKHVHAAKGSPRLRERGYLVNFGPVLTVVDHDIEPIVDSG
jgi:hypothetical protein